MTFIFEGFTTPNGTFVPDVVFDELAPQLTEAELRVLLYIIRRTFGFKKNADDISLKQMTEGIRTREGSVLDRGTGLSKAGNARGIRGLIEKRVVVARRNRSSARGDQATTYTLRYRQIPEIQNAGLRGTQPLVRSSEQAVPVPSPVSLKKAGGCLPSRQGGVYQVDTQDTVQQQTDFKSSNIRKAQPVDRRDEKSGAKLPSVPSSASGFESVVAILHRPVAPLEVPDFSEPEMQDAIGAYIADFAREFNDQAPVKSSKTRAVNLFRRSGLSLPAFISRLFEARAVTRESAITIRQKSGGHKTEMAYFFACLEDRLHLRTDAQKTHYARQSTHSQTGGFRSVPAV